MRILLRKLPGTLYFEREGHWTEDPEKAFNFRSIPNAVQFAFEHGLEHVEILMSFDDPQFNIRLPLRP